MKKTVYRCNVNQFVSFCVDVQKTFILFTPKEIGRVTALVDTPLTIPKKWGGAEVIETGGNCQLEDEKMNIIIIADM